MQTVKTLHVCVYYLEHKPMCNRLYGEKRVNEQLKRKKPKDCRYCLMFPYLLQYLDIDEKEAHKFNSINEDLYDIDYQKVPVKNRNMQTVGVRTSLIYRERELDVDDF